MTFLIILIAPALIISYISFFVPKQFFNLYINWCIILAILTYTEAIKDSFQTNIRFSGLSEDIFWMNAVVASLAIYIKFLLVNYEKLKNKQQKKANRKYLAIARKINDYAFTFTSIVYGLLVAYLLNLFHGDMFAGYQPAYQAYFIVVISIIFFIIFTIKITKTEMQKSLTNFEIYLRVFSCSLCVAMLALLIFSLSFPKLIIRETKKIIEVTPNQNPAYCIQMLTSNSRERYQSLTTLLNLSPLTMQSKALPGNIFGWGKPYFHALLIVKKQNDTYLYNWSYKQKKWNYLKPGFAKRVSIDRPKIICTPRQNYLQQIPLIFPNRQS